MVQTAVVDTAPEINKPLSAKYKRSFAYPTFTSRAPQILMGIVTQLTNDKTEIFKQYGQVAIDELDAIKMQIVKLKTEMESDEQLTEIEVANNVTDTEVNVYNKLISEKRKQGNVPTWFSTEWLFAECYQYRRLNRIFKNSKAMETYDPFMKLKIETLLGSRDSVIAVAKALHTVKSAQNCSEESRTKAFKYFLKCSLWGNQADLSLSGGKALAAACDFMESDETILANDSKDVYDLLTKHQGENTTVDIVLDNSGYELYNDLCFADYLIWSGLANTINFHGKNIPWFVSDVTHADFEIIFKLLKSEIKDDKLWQVVDQWVKYVDDGTWKITCEPFWTSPYDFSQMKSEDLELYKKLSHPLLLIFKGDLNYRKLVGDIHWNPITPFKTALRGFEPTNLVTFRTIKADTICGLAPGVAEEMDKKDPDWLLTGKYGLIQLLKK